jgi:GNAT superfamily N-acetyltransferase
VNGACCRTVGDVRDNIVWMELRDISPAADSVLAAALLQLQHAAYAVEATLIQDERIPALHENLDDVRRAPLLWLGAFRDGRLSGAVAWTQTTDQVDVDRLVVAPLSHRRGVGSNLVLAVLDRAAHRRTLVSTGRDNLPARRLYEGLGFVHVGDQEVIPSLWTAQYVHLPR